MNSFSDSENSYISANLSTTSLHIYNEPTTLFDNYGRLLFYDHNLSWKKSIVYKLTGTHLLSNSKKCNLINLLQRCEVIIIIFLILLKDK